MFKIRETKGRTGMGEFQPKSPRIEERMDEATSLRVRPTRSSGDGSTGHMFRDGPIEREIPANLEDPFEAGGRSQARPPVSYDAIDAIPCQEVPANLEDPFQSPAHSKLTKKS